MSPNDACYQNTRRVIPGWVVAMLKTSSKLLVGSLVAAIVVGLVGMAWLQSQPITF